MNLVIIGAGPAGEAAAKTAARISPDANITLVEKENAGGLCLNKGCVPSKSLLEQVRQAVSAGHAVDWNAIQTAKRGVVGGIRTQLEKSLKNSKITLVTGSAAFRDRSSLTVSTPEGEKTLPFDKAVLAAGTEIFFPPPLDTVQQKVLTSDTALELTKTPASILIIGGGAVGCEFACLLHAAGSKVTLVEMQEGLLPGEDPAIVATLTNSFEKRGIAVKTGVTVAKIVQSNGKWRATLSTGETIETDETLACVGRRTNLEPFQPKKAEIAVERGAPKLNAFLQTSNPNVFAAGDVTGDTRLAHAAAAHGEIAATNALGGNRTYDGRLVPRCLYSWPEVASVGEWKYQREEKNLPVKTGRAFFKGSSKALASGDAEGFVQIVSDPETGRVAGAQIIGPHATELIHIFSIAIAKETTLSELGEVIFAHPTLSEAVKEAARK